MSAQRAELWEETRYDGSGTADHGGGLRPSGLPTMPDLPHSPPLHTPEHGQTPAHLLWHWHRAAGRQGQPGGTSLLALDFLS